MSLFAAFALMTALAALAVLWPLSRARTTQAAREADLAVYRDQLAEIARDAKSGRLPKAEAEAARIEVARRMLAADAARETTGVEDPARIIRQATRRRRAAAVFALVFVPVFAVGLYGVLGSPRLPGAPLAERLTAAPDRSDVAILVRRVEEHLQKNPNDGAGYEILAPVYLRMGRPEDAARAYAEAIRILGPSAARHSSRGEALVAASDGLVTADAARAFADALALDPNEPRSAYFLGLAAEQDGRGADAARIWGQLLARTPANAPYRPMVAAALARVGGGAPAAPVAGATGPGTPGPGTSGPGTSGPGMPGPGAADVAAAASLSADERNAMVRGMVDRLAQRLDSAPNDIEGWLRLVRAYGVLGDKDKAAEALAKARATFKDNAEALGRLDAAEKELAVKTGAGDKG
ncbi:c-type cytochrome biogenesis protein CcmI [Xanthobacter autotrophicus]|uniref:c-type cytochrome biogenesis protein CcmI n=1 Tax=Xanthobacter autotrophicus TaxID=280 RepID=UPI0024A64678|nr:c-type cytochrome biogenesis protein CcmI [Xanthobacter autotrophicus]MDI4658858.1 c-type cytochrome biogenesis protein CcmI [Xanthobacter autotrophicus]